MPRQKLSGRDRLEVRASPQWIDTVTQAAASFGLNTSSYARLAISERVARDGFKVPPAEPLAAKTKGRPRGRPRKEK